MKKPTRYVLFCCAVLLLSSCVTNGIVTPLHEAVRDSRMGDARKEVEAGADVNASDPKGRTPLHYVCANGDPPLVKWLLAEGADPNRRDGNGDTPLHYAAGNCYTSIVRMLLAAGADAEVANDSGDRPIDLAVRTGCSETGKALEEVE